MADKVPEVVAAGVEDVVEAGAPRTGTLEAEVVGEAEDEVGEERVDNEEDDECPLEDGVGEDEGDLVGIPVLHRRELVRRLNRSFLHRSLHCYVHAGAENSD